MEQSKLKELVRLLEKDKTYKNYLQISSHINKNKANISDMPSLKVGILRNITIEPLLPVLEGEFIVEGFIPDIYLSDFDNINQEVLEYNSGLYMFSPDVVLMIQWLEMLAPEFFKEYSILDEEKTNFIINRIINNLESQINSFKAYSKVPLIINNFPITSFPTMSVLDTQNNNSVTRAILEINSRLVDIISRYSNVYIVDFFSIFSRFGFEKGFDKRGWYISSAPISKDIFIPIALEYLKFIRSLKGKAKKCLVLDCDETLWGGIIGESGINGIKIGDQYPGICYKAFQYEILNLYNRGVILALCSKNNEQDVLDVFSKHCGMVLREEHFSAYQINWSDKATNIIRISKELNIGLDSMVFVDDSEFECNLVKEKLPEVSVIKLPNLPSLYKETISTCGFFDSVFITEEDKNRTKTYKDNVTRKKIFETSNSIEDYLSMLEIEVEIGRPSDIEISRISQLTQKTNQFNLTTKRYDEEKIKEFLGNNQYDVVYLKVKDNISDMGIMGTAIVQYYNNSAYIDTFLLSCRVIGRNIEYALLQYLIENASNKGCKCVNGKYIITNKNQQVSQLYKNAGFELVEEDNLGSLWQICDKKLAIVAPKYIKVNIR
ncbi:MAG: HAD-superfamily phosphatase, subfamily IIIC/FkbH-like domain [Anaerocolumna sp.]|jgi:FkbH-like protein|nr:HAD-superfamily phosphatase, subfamily IIIC/FkbH-like domain [Anaerocolumna sp.]